MFTYILKKTQGFSLLELILVVFILSLLNMFAVPTYKSYLLKAQRIEIKSTLYDLANHLENYRLQNGTYKEAKIYTNRTTNKKYGLKISSATKTEFKIEALLQDVTQDPDCQKFTLTNKGIKSAFGNDSKQCW